MKRYLVLENGKIFEGEAIGADARVAGELVFTTGVIGYGENLTDPTYAGQILVHTFPTVGNYGVMPQDFEGSVGAAGIVVREMCNTPSNFRSEYSLEKLLLDKGIPGICGVDTREITKIIRNEGVMNACICDSVPESFEEIAGYKAEISLEDVSCKEAYTVGVAEPKYSVALIDYGVKNSIVEALKAWGCRVTVYPCTTPAEEILSGDYDGLVLSNGPGNPENYKYQIEQINKLFQAIPILGIGLGHQLVALARGGKIEKLKYGHRGANQPAKMTDGSRTYITTQNHGYAVVADGTDGTVSFVNANDNTCEGMEYAAAKAITVQFTPAAKLGAHSTGFVYEKFCSLMTEKGKDN